MPDVTLRRSFITQSCTMKRETDLPRCTIKWKIPGDVCEIRTVLFNWPADGVEHDMLVT